VQRRLRLRVLGPVTLLRPHPDGSASTVHIRRTASLQLLVYLAIHRDGAANDELKEALWPDVANSAATRRLATNLSELRRVLQDAAGGTVLQRTTSPPDGGNTRYQLDRDLIQVDLWQLHDLLNTATTAAGSTGRATLLHDAAALDRGALAQGLPGEWLDIDRETTARHLVDVYVHLADLETDDHAALRLLRRATEVAPHNEPLYRAVMRRHAAANDPNGVRSVLATAMARLAELGTAPDDETLNLAAGLCADLETATGNTAETTTSPGQGPR
jgi:DNA-binding SARP family transcriptional activator